MIERAKENVVNALKLLSYLPLVPFIVLGDVLLQATRELERRRWLTEAPIECVWAGGQTCRGCRHDRASRTA